MVALAENWTPGMLGFGVLCQLRLRRWPDLGAIERRRTFLNVGSRLVREASTLKSLTALYPENLSDLFVFLAGCRLCGWLEVGADIDEFHTIAVPPAPSSLIAAIDALRRALGMGGVHR
jgi:hypothetical protein